MDVRLYGVPLTSERDRELMSLRNRVTMLEAQVTRIKSELAQQRKRTSRPTPDTLEGIPPVQTTVAIVAREFCKRFESRMDLAWSPGPHTQALQDISIWVDKQARLEELEPPFVLDILLDNWFEDPFARQLKNPYSPKVLAATAPRVYCPPAVKIEHEPEPEEINARRIRERREREEIEQRNRLADTERHAVPPPPLAELLAGIGRDLE